MGKLYGYLAEIDEQAESMFELLVSQLAIAEGITEQLKTDDQMEWVAQMNSVRARATEIVNTEIVFTF